MWREQDKHEGDRQRLFTAVSASFPASRVLYPGSFVDIAASFVFDDVTYIDVDRRAARFFADGETVNSLIAEQRGDPVTWHFIGTDYRGDLGLESGSFDLLVSLYAGPVSEFCGHLVQPGGHVLANPSHGDVALLSLDERFSLEAVVVSARGSYVVKRSELDGYLVPKRPHPSRDEVLTSGRGVAYTRSPFAYIFQRVG